MRLLKREVKSSVNKKKKKHRSTYSRSSLSTSEYLLLPPPHSSVVDLVAERACSDLSSDFHKLFFFLLSLNSVPSRIKSSESKAMFPDTRSRFEIMKAKTNWRTVRSVRGSS